MRQHGPRSARRVRWTPRLLLFLLLLLPLFPGCKGYDTPWSSGSDVDDPLRPGGQIPAQRDTVPPPQPLPQPQPPPAPTQPATPTSPGAWLPSSPGTTTPTTPAGLTASGVRPAEPASDPRYGYQTPGQPTDGSGQWVKAPASSGASGNVQLHPPEPTTGPGTPASPASEVRQAGGVQTADSLDQAYAQLDGYGMSWSQLKQDGTNSTTYLFDCSIPNKQDPRLVDYFEGKGTSRLGAVRDAIDQINRKQAGK